jgi:type I restriction enzyme R subunit
MPPTRPSTTLLDEEEFETDGLDASSRDFLEDAIQDYNEMFGTSFDTSADKFQNYYKDLSQRLKNREIDLVIVVNMFLTGFDATTLNTLWVDKNLRAHGLIQAYSRTNRILNSVKTYGNIVSFRNLEEETNDAIALFGNKDAKGIVLLKPYAEYYEEYAEKRRRAARAYPAGPADHRRGGAEGVHRAVRLDPAAAQHPHVLRRLRRQRDPHRRGRCRTTRAST